MTRHPDLPSLLHQQRRTTRAVVQLTIQTAATCSIAEDRDDRMPPDLSGRFISDSTRPSVIDDGPLASIACQMHDSVPSPTDTRTTRPEGTQDTTASSERAGHWPQDITNRDTYRDPMRPRATASARTWMFPPSHTVLRGPSASLQKNSTARNTHPRPMDSPIGGGIKAMQVGAHSID
ncbi:hypothetical protein BV25DRAFT_1535943 [Artomyces pyxidatus]|uniref:Uncharacterized protein n=1 Tax=Artomyces pyxidatus TaxID=48021 RepID=A0ACB8SK43_9AGAM|nr:hypothetical protein BV25DRAFT_1535943 [Artomyces pyxidatus]